MPFWNMLYPQKYSLVPFISDEIGTSVRGCLLGCEIRQQEIFR
jgi:hypothetical protein